MSVRTLSLALGVALATAAPAQLRVTKRADLAVPVALAPEQAAIVVGFRRPDKQSAGKSGAVAFARYDLEKRDIALQPPNFAVKKGDTTIYYAEVASGDRTLVEDYAVLFVSAGDYVLYGATPGPTKQVANTFCLGAPSFHVAAGEVVYVGDFAPYMFVRLVDGSVMLNAMAWSSHPDAARAALAKQPALAAALKPAELRNGSSYACAGQAMTAYEVPGAPALAPPEPVAPAAP